jgi:carboxymethylenebutenolidase
MGGSWSFQSALLAEPLTKGCVMYYGFPEKDVEKMRPLASDVLFIQATKDGFIKNEDVENFAKNLQSVGKKITIKQYEADHAFANPSNPKYSKTFADEAHQIALAYLKKGFGL